jgi:hypothetical protein
MNVTVLSENVTFKFRKNGPCGENYLQHVDVSNWSFSTYVTESDIILHQRRNNTVSVLSRLMVTAASECPLYSSPIISTVIKSRRIKLTGNVARMGVNRKVFRDFLWET